MIFALVFQLISPMLNAMAKENQLKIKPFQTEVQIKGDIETSNKIFKKGNYTFEVQRDYEQRVNIDVLNTYVGNKSVYFKNVDNFNDIEIGFDEANREANALLLASQEQNQLQLNLFMQNAESTSYQFKLQAIEAGTHKVLDEAYVTITTEDYNFDVETNVTSVEGSALKYVTLTNQGDRIPDLSVIADSSLKDVVTFSPTISNAILEEDETIEFTVIPNYDLLKQKGYNGNLLAKSGGKEINIPLEFEKFDDELLAITFDELMNEHANDIEKEAYQEIAKNLNNNYEVSIENKTSFGENGGEFSIKFSPKNDEYAEAELNFKAEKVEDTSTIPQERVNIGTNDAGDLQLEVYVSEEEYKQYILANNTMGALTDYGNGLKYGILSFTGSDKDTDYRLTFTFVDTALNDLDVDPKWTKGTLGLSILWDGYNTIEQLHKVSQYNQNYTGQEYETKLNIYEALTFVNMVSTMAAYTPISAHPLGFIITNGLSYLSSLALSGLDELWFTNPAYTGPFEEGIFNLFFNTSQCINRKKLTNTLNTGNIYGTNSYGSKGYAYSRITPTYTNRNNVSRETISFNINGSPVQEFSNVYPDDMFVIEFDTDLIKNNDGLFEFTQNNTHNNRGSYIIYNDINIIIPITGNPTFKLPEKDKNQLKIQIKPLLPDFSANGIQFVNQHLVGDTTSDLLVNIDNGMPKDGNAPVKITVNDVVVYEKNIFVGGLTRKTITVEDVPLTAPKAKVVVEINGKKQELENNYSNNQASKSFTVLENDHEGPSIKLVNGTEDFSVNAIAAEVTDQLGVKDVQMFIDDEEVSVNAVLNQYRTFLNSPLQPGQHKIKVIATDFGNNKSEKEFTLTVLDRAEDLVDSITFKNNSYQVTLYESFDLEQELVILKDNNPVSINNLDDLTITVNGGTNFSKWSNQYSFYTTGSYEIIVQLGTIEVKATIQVVEPEKYEISLPTNGEQSNLELYGQYKDADWFNYISRNSYSENQDNVVKTSVYKQNFETYNQYYLSGYIGSKVISQFVSKDEVINNTIHLVQDYHTITFSDAYGEIQNIIIYPEIGLGDLEVYLPSPSGKQISLPTGKYKIKIQYGKKVEFKEIDLIDSLTLEPSNEALVHLTFNVPTNVTIHHLSMTANNRYQYSYQVENNEVDVVPASIKYLYLNAEYEDLNLYLQQFKGLNLDKDTQLTIDTVFEVKATLPNKELNANEQIVLEDVQFINKDGYELSSIYKSNIDYENIKPIAIFENVNNPNDKYEVAFDFYNPVITVPNTNGIYKLKITLPYFDEISSDESKDNKNSGNNGSGNSSSGGSSSRDNSTPVETPKTNVSVNFTFTGKDLEALSETNKKVIEDKGIKITLENNPIQKIKQESEYVLNLESKNAGSFNLTLSEKDKETISYFAKPIEIELDEKIYGDAIKEGKVLMRKVGDTFVTVPHRVENGKFIITTRHSGEYVFVNNDKSFSDIGNVFSKDQIATLAKYGIVNGQTPTTFSPYKSITRAQFSAMLARALGIQATTNTNFDDVQGEWFEDYVQALYENGIVFGSNDHEFNPNSTLTRQQAALMIHRTLKYAGYDFSQVAIPDTLNYTDANSIDDFAIESVAALQALGIMTGKENGNFDPKAPLTRAQMAKALYETLVKLGYISSEQFE